MRDDPDYYKILGVLKTAKSAEITAAYHFLARKYHPDVGATDSESLAKFKLVSEAHDVLIDEKKRRNYDQRRRSRVPTHRTEWDQRIVSTRPLPAQFAPLPPNTEIRAEDIKVELPISPEESLYGGQCEFTLRFAGQCDECRARPLLADGTCGVCGGKGYIRESHRLRLALPRGLQSGSVIRLAGHGKQTARSVGDLLIRIRIQPYW